MARDPALGADAKKRTFDHRPQREHLMASNDVLICQDPRRTHRVNPVTSTSSMVRIWRQMFRLASGSKALQVRPGGRWRRSLCGADERQVAPVLSIFWGTRSNSRSMAGRLQVNLAQRTGEQLWLSVRSVTTASRHRQRGPEKALRSRSPGAARREQDLMGPLGIGSAASTRV